MYALILNEEIFLFDKINSYGFYKRDEVNLEGYVVLYDFMAVLNHFMKNYFDSNLIEIEQYNIFLLRICLDYIKDLSL